MTWQLLAACREADHRLFLANTLDAARPALVYCAGCPVRNRCASSRGREVDGVWGGHVYDRGGHRVDSDPPPDERLRCEVCGSTAATGIPTCRGVVCKTRRKAYDRRRYELRKWRAA